MILGPECSMRGGSSRGCLRCPIPRVPRSFTPRQNVMDCLVHPGSCRPPVRRSSRRVDASRTRGTQGTAPMSNLRMCSRPCAGSHGCHVAHFGDDRSLARRPSPGQGPARESQTQNSRGTTILTTTHKGRANRAVARPPLLRPSVFNLGRSGAGYTMSAMAGQGSSDPRLSTPPGLYFGPAGVPRPVIGGPSRVVPAWAKAVW